MEFAAGGIDERAEHARASCNQMQHQFEDLAALPVPLLPAGPTSSAIASTAGITTTAGTTSAGLASSTATASAGFTAMQVPTPALLPSGKSGAQKRKRDPNYLPHSYGCISCGAVSDTWGKCNNHMKHCCPGQTADVRGLRQRCMLVHPTCAVPGRKAQKLANGAQKRKRQAEFAAAQAQELASGTQKRKLKAEFSAAQQAHAQHQSSRGVCFAFQKGACTRGDACRFTHAVKGDANHGDEGGDPVVAAATSEFDSTAEFDSTRVILNAANIGHFNSLQIAGEQWGSTATFRCVFDTRTLPGTHTPRPLLNQPSQ